MGQWPERNFAKTVIRMNASTNTVETMIATAAGIDADGHPPVVAPSALKAHRLTDLVRRGAGQDPDELLKHRFLSKGGGLLLVGPTGVGKSSLAMQLALMWALGRPCFGIVPARPLKSLMIQAENDDGDLAEMRDGVIAGLELTAEDAKTACDNIIVVREDSRTGGEFTQVVVRPMLEEHEPGLLWIDPALAYLGGEANSQKDVGAFLRNQLNPLIHEFNCGVVVVHHTNKPLVGKEKREWNAGDFAYLGGGSAEWANWARGVIAVRSIGSHSVYELRAGKRGGRLGWKDRDGQTPTHAKFIAHSQAPGTICWHEATEADAPPAAQPRRAHTKADILPHVPLNEPIPKESLRSAANAAGIPLNKINPLIAELVDDGSLFEWKKRRPGTNPRKLLSRTPQPSEDSLELDTHTET